MSHLLCVVFLVTSTDINSATLLQGNSMCALGNLSLRCKCEEVFSKKGPETHVLTGSGSDSMNRQ